MNFTRKAEMENLTRCSYAVVKFPDESGCLSIVPISWLVTTSSGTLCRWPPANVSLKKASKKLANPTDEWKSYKAIPVHYSRTYKSANEYLEKCKYSSEVELFSSDGDLPPPPPKKKRTQLALDTIAEETNAGPSKRDFNRLEAKVDILVKNIAELKEELRDSKEIIRNFRRSEHHDLMNYSTESFKILENLQDLKDFDENLKNEDEFAKAVKRCGYIGGKDVKDAVRRILSTIFSHQLALDLSWNQANGKSSIQDYKNLLLLINVSLHSNQDYKNVPRIEIEDVIKRWLRYASDRNGGRYKRMKKSVVTNVVPNMEFASVVPDMEFANK